MKAMSFLFFGGSPWMKASIYIFFVSTSIVPSQLIVEKRFPSRKTFHFLILMEKPHHL
jgi:hypothetical protein